MKIDNTEKLLNYCKSYYGDKYDYSYVNYVKSSIKVKLICYEHGEFYKRPNHLIKGSGCPKCGRNRNKNKLSDIIIKAKSIHGDKYDYSKIIYSSMDSKVIIVCPVHGDFLQTLHGHISSKNGCPSCNNDLKRERFINNNPMKNKDCFKKMKSTNMDRYGSEIWSKSEEGRKKLSNIISSNEVQNKIITTNLNKYGVKSWCQSIEGRSKLKELMSSETMKQKVIDGYISNYGVTHYMKLDEARSQARLNINRPEHRQKLIDGMLSKYGYKSSFEIPEIKNKISKSIYDKYGVHLIGQSKIIQNKILDTKRKNKTFSSSFPEEQMYLLLCDKFGETDVLRQYKSEFYPFNCDFYIKSKDLYIELNGSWTHGGHWFDSSSLDDVLKLHNWSSKNSDYYDDAIMTWTKRDLNKRDFAIKNKLNYLVFWDCDLTDFYEWLLSI